MHHGEAYCIKVTSIVIIGKCLIEYKEKWKCERKNQKVIWKHRKWGWDEERHFQTQRNPKHPHGGESQNTHTDISWEWSQTETDIRVTTFSNVVN